MQTAIINSESKTDFKLLLELAKKLDVRTRILSDEEIEDIGMANAIRVGKSSETKDEDMLEHYDFDYSQAQPNRFAPILAEQNGYIKLQPDIHKVFQTSDEVNNALRAFIDAIPKKNKRKKAIA
jgi:hypothetical protein